MYHWYHHRPSRLFWFIIGAASATLWIKHREHRFADGRTYGPCVRQRPLQSTSPQQVTSAGLEQLSNAVPPLSAVPASDTLRTVSRAINSLPPAESWNFGERSQMERWEEDKDKLVTFTLRATDAIAEMSESTIDAVLETVERLKMKIAEHRAQREQQRKRFDEQLEDEKKRSRHLV